MRARHVFLAILIIAGGLAVTAYHRGVFGRWEKSARDWTGFAREVADLTAENAAFSGLDWQEAERLSKEVDAESATALTVENLNGNVVVRGGAGRGIKINAVHFGRGATAGNARQNARDTRLLISRSGDTMTIAVTGPPHFERHARLDLEITAPRKLNLRVKTISGTVRVGAMYQSVEASAVSGDVSIFGASQVKTSNVSGNLLLKDITGDVHSKIVSGNFSLKHYTGANANVESVSGGEHITMSDPFSGQFTARSISGEITLSLPEKSDCTIDLKSVSGEMHLNLPLQKLSQQKMRKRGMLGAGRGRINLETVSGSISLNPAE